jgi:DNA-binding GntR family transcriptional regulator
MADSWERLTSTTLTDRVYQALRGRILGGKVTPGEFIREQEVSDGLGVSRTPVRESLGRLASEGFLERIPHRGFRVPKESIRELIDLYPIIGALETLAARLSFPQIDQDALAQLRTINRGYEEAKRREDIRAGIELNDQFHHVLSEQSGNRRLCELLDELRTQVKRLEIWAFSDCFEDWDGSIAEHEEILRAIEKKNYQHGLEVLERNRLTTYKDFVEKLGQRVSEGVAVMAKRG